MVASAPPHIPLGLFPLGGHELIFDTAIGEVAPRMVGVGGLVLADHTAVRPKDNQVPPILLGAVRQVKVAIVIAVASAAEDTAKDNADELAVHHDDIGIA